jgi:chorismate mutase
MPAAIRALRGATTIDEDTPEAIDERVLALFEALFDRNDLQHDDLISVILTATPDIHSQFPATSARKFGLGDVPLLCAQELDIAGAMPRCIRVLVHLSTERTRAELHHVYLEGTQSLRDDLPA